MFGCHPSTPKLIFEQRRVGGEFLGQLAFRRRRAEHVEEPQQKPFKGPRGGHAAGRHAEMPSLCYALGVEQFKPWITR